MQGRAGGLHALLQAACLPGSFFRLSHIAWMLLNCEGTLNGVQSAAGRQQAGRAIV
jgi:hypothetical protein